ncbi:hypothetical protein EXE59_09765 [Nocardioides eburneiflavus]|uniref:Type II secretion system protein n=1 Tax=Nocardioides eburneiflavus TaxID=2518372 RepID=A0A4Z1CE76_9ACTN|nr:hypothetical protein [Nocardioides eburneiflavus]TGN64205.1 hypothetical protein EXE59_09765 [Nocardioides eburneiflavus]
MQYILARLHARLSVQPSDEQGSLILDVLIGIAIFALIAIIAVSAIGQYRQRTYEQGAVSDVQTLARALEAARIDGTGYPAVGPVNASAFDTILTPKNSAQMLAVGSSGEDFTLCVEHSTSGARAVYDSLAGGVIESERTGGCDSAYVPIEIPVEVPTNPVDPDDRDGDGLTNDLETAEGFDPDDAYSWRLMGSDVTNPMGVNDYQVFHSVDTDADGMWDFMEVAESKSNGFPGRAGDLDWNDPDTDGDGVGDWDEIGNDLDPTDPHSWVKDYPWVSDHMGVTDGDHWDGIDSDSDGVPDSAEVQNGTDHMDPNFN